MINRNYSVYMHPTKKTIAFPTGFSWLGFFFTWIWALFSKMWLFGVAWGILSIGTVNGINAMANLDDLHQNSVMILVNIVSGLIFGFFGNRFRAYFVEAKGYTKIAQVIAKNRSMALAKAVSSKE